MISNIRQGIACLLSLLERYVLQKSFGEVRGEGDSQDYLRNSGHELWRPSDLSKSNHCERTAPRLTRLPLCENGHGRCKCRTRRHIAFGPLLFRRRCLFILENMKISVWVRDG